jgi:hypothetical protein
VITMPKQPSEAVVDAWIALMRAQQTTLLKIERAFREAKLPPHAWYDVLWELERAGAAGLRPFEIERWSKAIPSANPARRTAAASA